VLNAIKYFTDFTIHNKKIRASLLNYYIVKHAISKFALNFNFIIPFIIYISVIIIYLKSMMYLVKNLLPNYKLLF